MQVVAHPSHVTLNYYTGTTDKKIKEAMDADLKAAEAEGGTLRHRTKIGRNKTCPCGSGLKFKKCCLSLAKNVT